MLDIAKYLTHKCDIYNLAPSNSIGSAYPGGDATTLSDTAVEDVECFVYFGNENLVVDSLGGAHVMATATRWQVILPNDWLNVLLTGAKIANIRDENGDTIREAGYVKEVNNYRHHIYGGMCVLAKLDQ